MKQLIQERLSRMEDLEQRKLLKNIMTGVFLNLVDYQDNLNRRLEERVFGEVEEREDRHDLYVTICAREDIDPIHEFLYPMLEADAEQAPCDVKDMLARINRREEARLTTVFLQCGYDRLKQLHAGRRTFQGEIVTSAGTYAIRIRLKQNDTYLRELEQLYHIFQKNNVPWKTVNHPYMSKFFDVMWDGGSEPLREDADIREIRLDLEEYDRFKRMDIVPMWNIERLALKNVGFPVPAADRVNFEHVLSLRKTGPEHGYLVDGDDDQIRYIKRSTEELTIVSPQEKSGIWRVLKITQPVQSRIAKRDDHLVSNKRKSSFTGGFARKQAVPVRAKGEILRIVGSFEAAEALELVDIAIREHPDGKEVTYGMNPFISDNVRVEEGKRVMRLRFRRRPEADEERPANSFILQDMMSFLVSEVQMYFPEYRCEGEWA